MNHQVNQVEMPKNIVMVEPDGSEVNVSRWLKPLNDRVGRSNRPIFDVVETETSLIYSFVGENIEVELMANFCWSHKNHQNY